MLSKCANPECSEMFKYLHKGTVFCLSPTPEVEVVAETIPALHERFWLCDQCSKTMTLVWGGTEAKLVARPIASEPAKSLTPQPKLGTPVRRRRRRAQAASADREDR